MSWLSVSLAIFLDDIAYGNLLRHLRASHSPRVDPTLLCSIMNIILNSIFPHFYFVYSVKSYLKIVSRVS